MPAAWEMIAPPTTGAGAPQSENKVMGKPTVVGQVTPTPPVDNQRANRLLAVLVPHTGTMSSEWTLMLREMPLPQGSQIFMSRGMPIDVTRDSMVKTVLDLGFQYLFFLDSDVILPKDALQKLLSHNLPLVCGIYKSKKPNGFWNAIWMKSLTPDGKEAFVPVASWTDRLFAVDVTGCGCMLAHRKVFEGIRAKTDLPFFMWTKDRDPELLKKMNIPTELMPLMGEISEDFWFCLLAKYCGFPVVIDGDVLCGHICSVKVDEKMVSLPGV